MTRQLLCGLITGLFFAIAAAPLAAQSVPEALYFKFNEGTGTGAVNEAVPGHGLANPSFTGTSIGGSPTWNTSDPRLGGSALALGSGSAGLGNFETGDWVATALPPTQDFTIEFWFRNASTANQTLMGDDFSPSFSILPFRVQLNYTSKRLAVTAGSSFLNSEPSPQLWDGQWHHVAFVYSASTNECHWYVDGHHNSTFMGQTLDLWYVQSFRIGHITNSFHGEIDELRFWKSARSERSLYVYKNVELPVTSDVAVINDRSPAGDVLPASATDLVIMDLAADVINASQSINSITLAQTGHLPDTALSTIKLVHDVNANGVVDQSDVVLDQGTLSNGRIVFNWSTPTQVAAGQSTKLLVAVSYAATLSAGYSIQFTLESAADVNWSGGTDSTGFPLASGEWIVPGPAAGATLGQISGSLTSFHPFNWVQAKGRMQTAYTPSELNLPPNTALNELRVAGAGVSPIPEYGNLRLRLAHSTLGTGALTAIFDNNYIGTLETVLGPANYTPSVMLEQGTLWYVFSFTTPFIYNGTQNLLVDWSYDSRSGPGFTIGLGSPPPSGENARSRVLLAGGTYQSVSGTAASEYGNYGVRFVLPPAQGTVSLQPNVVALGIATPEVDKVVWDANAASAGATRSINSITFTSTGTVTDGEIFEVKLFLDNDANGNIDPTDTLLGADVLSGGQVTFSGSPLISVPDMSIAGSVRLLLTVTILGKVSAGASLDLRVDFASDVSWSGGDDLSIYPITPGMHRQPLSGTFTVANGNPGGSFDFGDLGDAFDLLEEVGVCGPVVLEMYDNGGPFHSRLSYHLGANGAIPLSDAPAIAGLSAMNNLAIRAAPGNSPVIQGSGAQNGFTPNATGTLSFTGISYLSVEGLTLKDGTDYGVTFYSASGTGPQTDVSVRRCRIHGVAQGPAIFVFGSGNNPTHKVLIENNMIWDIAGDAGFIAQFQNLAASVICVRSTGNNFVMRHNTIVHMGSEFGTSRIIRQGSGYQIAIANIEYNIIYSSVPSTVLWSPDSGTHPLPLSVDRNIIYLPGGGQMSSVPGLATWAEWQTAGFDLNGLNVDPQLVSLATGQENLYLQPTSPAIDLAVGSPTMRDIDGNLRPMGAAPDSGAHEYGDQPDMIVEFGATPVSLLGNSNVGDVLYTTGDDFVFTIRNAGLSDLVLTGTPAVSITLGPNTLVSTGVPAQPGATTISPSGSTTFTLHINPAVAGPFELVVEIPSSDGLKNPFRFTVEGMGIAPNAPAQAHAPSAVSNFVGATNGPFSLVVDPGDVLAGALIELTDVNGDDVTVNSISIVGGAPTGIVTPSIPTPGQPLELRWTGTAAASNAPGDYIWNVEFVDAVNGTPVLIQITITIRDLPPMHAIGDADGGVGSASDPYTTSFTQGDDASISVNIVAVSDPNSSQLLSVASVAPGSNPPGGAGFQFSVVGGFVAVAPAGTLLAADAGFHSFTVTVEDDGNNPAAFEVGILVYSDTGAISFTTPQVLKEAELNTAYVNLIQVTGATGAVTFRIIAGGLPTGLALNPATGEITGQPFALGTEVFTVRAYDGSNDTATLQFELTVSAQPLPRSGSSSASGCSSRAEVDRMRVIALLAAFAAVCAACRRLRRVRQQ